jgi:hypothetical protein
VPRDEPETTHRAACDEDSRPGSTVGFANGMRDATAGGNITTGSGLLEPFFLRLVFVDFSHFAVVGQIQ